MASPDIQGRVAADVKADRASTATNTKATVGAASSVISTAKRRVSLMLVNDSDSAIYVAKGGTAALNEGIRLNAYGGSTVIEDWDGAVAAISSGASKNIAICETV